jgi:serine protease inhibitor
MKRRYLILICLPLTCCSLARGQEVSRDGFSKFLAANDRFGKNLLKNVQGNAPGRNVVVSPIPVSLAFAPLSDTTASVQAKTLDEVRKAFGWQDVPALALSARMLLARFDNEKMGISTSFLYRSNGKISKAFVDRGKKYFGLEFKSFPPDTPLQEIFPNTSAPSREAQMTTSQRSDFWIVSSTHLQSLWAGNTFSLGTKKEDIFRLSSGADKKVHMITSESSRYLHAKTEDFEAIALYAFDANLLVILPAPDKDITSLEAALAQDNLSPDSQLRWEIGEVELPEFKFRFDVDLHPALEKMGIHEIFEDIGALSAMIENGAELQGVFQSADIEVNREGIRANAATVVNGIYGGICGNCAKPFHMVVNRPFLFFIRDNQTGTLLFVGSIFDPDQN